ncbi:MAG: D-amino-acid transaminase [Micavibrio aeruginosavorus]|uniref:branched-chain-amino-acid transaminase n=1 Tax=Micavibrio aeruginosavorus TaxID=349221 RepID=A0A7T5R0R6_9BACT|nr:MAG: D-amino-acid transaminase [Micavibrio aeruginosavorus]
MPRYAYVNDSYIAHRNASVHIEDRGYQFADGVYEVIALINGDLADERGHLDRLERSLAELSIAVPLPRQTLLLKIKELIRRNRLRNANIYIQVTRGVAKRDFKFPDRTRPSLVITAWPFRFDGNTAVEKGAIAVSVPDIRWKRPDIKSVALLPQVLAKQAAAEKGAYEAWMVDSDGYVTEGSSSNAWIVTKQGKIVTHSATQSILRGVTRTAIIRICQELQMAFEERPFTLQEAYAANEAFNTSAVALIVPIVELDGYKIGSGQPGPVARRLYEEYRSYVKEGRSQQLPWTA